MSTLSSANVTDINLVLKERTHMRLCINMLIFTHNLGNWLIKSIFPQFRLYVSVKTHWILEKYIGDISWDKEVPIKCWKSSRSGIFI